MRILADENVEQLVIERLRNDGHTVIAVSVESSGETDLPILARAVSENLLLLTADLDFGEYIFRDHQLAPAAGIVQYRLGDVFKAVGEGAGYRRGVCAACQRVRWSVHRHRRGQGAFSSSTSLILRTQLP